MKALKRNGLLHVMPLVLIMGLPLGQLLVGPSPSSFLPEARPVSVWGSWQAEAASNQNTFVQQQPVILRVAFDPGMAPLSFIATEVPQGFSIDLMDAMAQENDWIVEYMPMPLHQARKAVQQGEVDLILALDYQARLASELEFTEPYLSSSVGLIVPMEEEGIDSMGDLSEKLVAIGRYSQEHDFLQNVWRINFNTTENLNVALQLLEMGRAEALAGDRIMLQYLLEENQLVSRYRFVSSYLIPVEYTMAVSRENYTMLNQLNRGLQQMKGQGIHNQLLEKWFGETDTRARLEEMLRLLAIVLGVTMTVFLVILWWNQTLKGEVQRKTRELKGANQDLEHQIMETRNMSQLMEQIMRNSPRGLLTLDRQGMVTALNPRAQELTKMQEDLRQRHYQESDLLTNILDSRIQKVLEEGTQYMGGELRWFFSGDAVNSNQVDIRYTLYPARDVTGQITGMIVTLEDITEERKMRDEDFQREKSRALHQVVAGIAHEIRNPLTSIKTFVELIPSKINNLQFQENIALHVPREIDRVSQLIESLIDYARPQVPNKEVFEAQQLLEACLALFQPVFHKKGLALEATLAEDCLIRADRNQMKQVLVNFLLNGLEAMVEKQENQKDQVGHEPLVMKMCCHARKDKVLITLADQGIGMGTEELEIMLEPFYSTKKTGTGLGLPLSKRHLEDNGGTLQVESEKGKGTTITLEFQRMENLTAKGLQAMSGREKDDEPWRKF